jgi:hypothetical protein
LAHNQYCWYSFNGLGNFAGELVQDDMDRPHLIFTGGLDNEHRLKTVKRDSIVIEGNLRFFADAHAKKIGEANNA